MRRSLFIKTQFKAIVQNKKGGEKIMPLQNELKLAGQSTVIVTSRFNPALATHVVVEVATYAEGGGEQTVKQPGDLPDEGLPSSSSSTTIAGKGGHERPMEKSQAASAAAGSADDPWHPKACDHAPSMAGNPGADPRIVAMLGAMAPPRAKKPNNGSGVESRVKTLLRNPPLPNAMYVCFYFPTLTSSKSRSARARACVCLV